MMRAILIGLSVCVAMTACAGEKLKSDKAHHTPDGFRNVYLEEENSFFDFIKWRWQHSRLDIPGPEDYQFESIKPDIQQIKQNNPNNQIVWIGHATVLVQMAGINILTDPQFSNRASPFQWFGPQRVVPPALSIDELPDIHVVIISHDHYDSLDQASVRALVQRPYGENTIFFVPLGLKSWFEDLGIQNVIELDWWEHFQFDAIKLTAVPVQHWSKRTILSKNTTLWAGWVLESNDKKIFFAGDSGYVQHFKEIGDYFGAFDLALVPIGAYEPRWFMKNHHVSPEESILIHEDVNAKKSVAIHWGTFILTDEPLTEPPIRLKKAMQTHDMQEEDFVVLQHGETLLF